MNGSRTLIRNPTAADEAIVDLRQRLDAFYANTTDYPLFSEHAGRPATWYRVLDPVMADVLRHSQPKILEVGAGRTRFAESLGEHRSRARFHVQDVTEQNASFLREVADRVFIGDIASIPEDGYHLIFSTYVLEHVSAPEDFLREVEARLAPGGWHVVICPRYDVPGYLNPSLRHLPLPRRIALSLFLTPSRAAVALGASPAFWVNLDPAVFHRPWYTDADAVHLVSRFDLTRWHRAHGFRVVPLRLPCGNTRDWIAKRLLTLAIAFRKRG